MSTHDVTDEAPAGAREHWEAAHSAHAPEAQSWFQARVETSLALIDAAGCGVDSRIIDVGGGASYLVDTLLARGQRDVSVLDIASTALARARSRLGNAAAHVHWIEADITSATLAGPYDLWHDRAVFHFLTDARDRAAYVHTLRSSLAPDGHVIIATFAQDGPTRCSGLPVVRYDPRALAAELGQEFKLTLTRSEQHRTPAGRDQSFIYCLFRMPGVQGR